MRRRMLLLGLAIVTVLFLLNWSLRLCMGRMDRIASSSSLVNSQANLILDADDIAQAIISTVKG